MVTIAKKSTILVSLPVLLTFHSLHAQSGFISVNAPANATTPALAADGDASTGNQPFTLAYAGAVAHAVAAETAGTRNVATAAADTKSPQKKTWLNPHLPIDQRVTTIWFPIQISEHGKLSITFATK